MAALRSFYTMYLMVLDGNYVVTSYLGKRKGKERSVLLESKEKKTKNKEYQIELWLERRLENTVQYDTHSILIRFEVLHQVQSKAVTVSTRILVLFAEIKCGVPRLFVCVFADIQSSQTVQLFQLFFFFFSFPPPHQVPAIEVVKRKYYTCGTTYNL